MVNKYEPNKEERLIFMILGDGCNLNCEYCIEREKGEAYKINPAIYDYLIDKSKRYRIKAVTFYGGEPTIYFDHMKEIVEHLDGYGIHFSTMTNGKAITPEMVNFFNKHYMSVNVSWDGHGSSYSRGYNAVESNPNILDIEYLWLTCVLNKYISLKEIIAEANEVNNEYIKKHNHSLNLHINTPIKAYESDVYDIDVEKLEAEQEWIVNKEPENDIERFVQSYIMRSSKDLYEHRAPLLRRCGIGRNMIVMDTEGYMYPCKNTRTRIGNINKSPESLAMDIISMDTGLKNVDECENCDVFNICMGGCRLLKYREHFCALQKAVFRPVIKKLLKDKNE